MFMLKLSAHMVSTNSKLFDDEDDYDEEDNELWEDQIVEFYMREWKIKI
jgi:hypothetical protein